MLQITSDIAINTKELDFEYSRSPGPGGQHVNKVATKVTLVFNVAASSSLTARDKERIEAVLGSRLTKNGVLRVTCHSHRSQRKNWQGAVTRFIELLHDALTPTTPRRRTHRPQGAQQRRLENKRRQARKKQLRQRPREAFD